MDNGCAQNLGPMRVQIQYFAFRSVLISPDFDTSTVTFAFGHNQCVAT